MKSRWTCGRSPKESTDAESPRGSNLLSGQLRLTMSHNPFILLPNPLVNRDLALARPTTSLRESTGLINTDWQPFLLPLNPCLHLHQHAACSTTLSCRCSTCDADLVNDNLSPSVVPLSVQKEIQPLFSN